MTASRRVLLTGASGFVGSHVLEELVRRGHHVVVIASFTCNGTMDRILDVTQSLGRSSITLISHDLTRPLSTRQRAQVGDVAWVVDLASRSSVDESLADPECFVLNNVGVTLTTLELARTLDLQRYLHLSTDEVHGSTRAESVSDHRPSSPYAASKAAQDDLCDAYRRSYAVPLTLARSANMFGPRQSTLAFIPKLIRAALRNETVLVHTHEGQPGRRSYNYVGDVARALVDELEGPPHPFVTYPGRYRVDNLELTRDVWYLTWAYADLPHREPRITLVNGSDVRRGYDPTYQPLAGNDAWLDPDNLAESPYLGVLSDTVEWFVAHRDWLP